MSGLEPPHSHYLRAASGWLELGLPDEARRELVKLDPSLRRHPEVLAVEWDLHAREGQWELALDAALRQLEVDRVHPTGWINRAYALHAMQRTAEARDALLPALPLFPGTGLIPYNLACYACQLGRLDEARAWLRQAMKIDGRKLTLERARSDIDLARLSSELDHL